VKHPPRVVIDTNLVLSALVFAGGRLEPLRQAWQAQRVLPLVSRTTAAELIRALAYPKFKLAAHEQEELLADYLPYCKTVRIPVPPPPTPPCRDAFDVPFLELALTGKADAMVTGDKDLLSLAGSLACPILGADGFFRRFNIDG
jgi:putative PIN family toxin of toxin-antitoxin system